MKLRHFVSLLTVAVACTGSAQTFSTAAGSAEADVQKAERELADLRRKIADEKIPLSQELTKLENTVLTKRRDFQAARLRRDNEQVDLNGLRNEVKARQDENAYMSNLMGEYIRNFETRVHPAEVQLYRQQALDALNVVENPNLSAAEKFQQQIAVIRVAMERIEKAFSGEIFAGEALDANNVVQTGKFVVVGPIAMFANDAGSIVGLAEQVNAPLPAVLDIGEEFRAGITQLVTTGSGPLPVDSSLGNALRLKLTETTIVDEFNNGGIVMYPIFALAFVTLLVVIFKWFEISAVKRPKAGVVQSIINDLNKGDDAKALSTATSLSGPFGDVLVAGVKNAREEKELLEEVLYERMLAAQPKLERLLAFVALAAGAAPLLGLLGTVTGMIQTFKLITVFGTGDAGKLASGISEALLTTKWGLIVAIPSLLGHALLARMAKGKLSELEQTSVAFVNGISSGKDK
jgi:biopolymer transport protein ExbB